MNHACKHGSSDDSSLDHNHTTLAGFACLLVSISTVVLQLVSMFNQMHANLSEGRDYGIIVSGESCLENLNLHTAL